MLFNRGFSEESFLRKLSLNRALDVLRGQAMQGPGGEQAGGFGVFKDSEEGWWLEQSKHQGERPVRRAFGA